MARKTVIIRNGRTDGRRWRIIIHFIRRRIQLSRNELYCFIYWVLESMLYFEYFIYIFLSFIYDKNLVILLKIASFETVVDFCQRRLLLLDERKDEFFCQRFEFFPDFRRILSTRIITLGKMNFVLKRVLSRYQTPTRIFINWKIRLWSIDNCSVNINSCLIFDPFIFFVVVLAASS